MAGHESNFDDQFAWIPDAAIANLQQERIVRPDKTNMELARELLTDAAPMAAQSLAWLSTHAANESIRLKASQYIIDGVVGGAWSAGNAGDDLLMALVSQLAKNDASEGARHM
jgi:hypothetical protein